MEFYNKLRSLIEEKKITQKQLAIELQIPVSTLGGYVQGTSEPDFETLKMISKYFGVTPNYLLDYHTDNVKNNKEEDILRIFRSLSSDQQDLYLEQGKAFLKINSKENAKYSNIISQSESNAG